MLNFRIFFIKLYLGIIYSKLYEYLLIKFIKLLLFFFLIVKSIISIALGL